MKLRPSAKAAKLIARLDAQKRTAVEKALLQFQADPRHPSLHFEKLGGFADIWSIRLGRGDRMILRRLAEDEYEIADLGPHDIYRSLR